MCRLSPSCSPLLYTRTGVESEAVKHCLHLAKLKLWHSSRSSTISLQVLVSWSLHLVNVICSGIWQCSTIRERPISCDGISTVACCWATTLHSVGCWSPNVLQNYNPISNQNALEEQPITYIKKQCMTYYLHLMYLYNLKTPPSLVYVCNIDLKIFCSCY